MSYFYCTSDRIGIQTGGGSVTNQELLALVGMAAEKETTCTKLECSNFDTGPFSEWGMGYENPWRHDEVVCRWVETYLNGEAVPKLAHFYSGTFSKTIKALKEKGCKISYTCAAHDKDISRREHEALGLSFNLPHLTDPNLWARYLEGYKLANVVIVPSTHSRDVLRRYGLENRIEVIPHGVHIPDESKIKPFPKMFTVGFLSAGCGAPDKGLVYLLQAWKQLGYTDALLMIAGRDSTSPWVMQMVNQFGGGNICLRGWVDDVADFYGSIFVLCQPSTTEGFGIGVVDALAYARPVICSIGAGAADTVPEGWRVPACDADALANKIRRWKSYDQKLVEKSGLVERIAAKQYDWKNIRQKYVNLWKELLT